MTTETVTKIENFILSLGLRLAQSTSDWSECQSLLNRAGDSSRKVTKTDVASRRTAPHGLDVSTKNGKAKAQAFARAASDLNAADVLDIDRAALEEIRLALKQDAPKAPASK